MNFEGRTEIEGPAGGRSKFVARPLCVQRERNDLAKNPATEFAYSLERNGVYSISEIRNLRTDTKQTERNEAKGELLDPGCRTDPGDKGHDKFAAQ